ncbi:MAG: ABC transporter ATP-binding protein [Cytophagales bacterium]|nr:ABC transporter ATP-binding protein [Cytophagales bacterium]
MIQVKNLSFTYPGSTQPVLQALNFEISEGEIFGFLGPSGAGKSTTQKILYKILHNFSGEVFIQDKPLDQWGKAYFERIGVGFELPNHYLKLSGKENLELFSSFYKKERLLKIPDLFEMVGLQDSMNKKVEAYSKGMKMRLNFIRAIMNNPDILFFDEPTAGLDPVNGHKIKEHIVDLKNQGKTIFITTHDMATADEICDRVSFIVDGRLRVTETPSTLKHQHGENKVSVESKDGKSAEFSLENLGKNLQFLEFIQENQLLRINTMEATLEQVFIQVTGKTLKV